MKKKFTISLSIIFVLIFAFGLLYYYSKKEINHEEEYKDVIEDYDYKLSSNATQLYKTHFYELKDLLESGSFNNEDYAKKVSILFIIDLYTLSNKENKYDVGGVEFIYPDNLENYELKVKDTIYKYISTKSKKDRMEVTSINITNFEYDEEENNYIIDLKWSYNKDEGYDNNSKITLTSLDKKIYIINHEGVYESIN